MAGVHLDHIMDGNGVDPAVLSSVFFGILSCVPAGSTL